MILFIELFAKIKCFGFSTFIIFFVGQIGAENF